jgi:hypothetical protein
MVDDIFKNYYENCTKVINIMLEVRLEELGLPKDSKVLYYISNDDKTTINTFKTGEVTLLKVVWKGIECKIYYKK